jgi:hypothetical protein
MEPTGSRVQVSGSMLVYLNKMTSGSRGTIEFYAEQEAWFSAKMDSESQTPIRLNQLKLP